MDESLRLAAPPLEYDPNTSLLAMFPVEIEGHSDLDLRDALGAAMGGAENLNGGVAGLEITSLSTRAKASGATEYVARVRVTLGQAWIYAS